MKLRRRKGATLGLVAVSVLVIIMIGVGCFFLAKICGGSREVTNATDAGTLNVARAALRSRDAEVPVPPAGYPSDPASFATLADPVYGGMTLYTYNRAVAEALLVALNAQQEGTPTSASNATTVYNELTALGQSLTTALKAQATLQNRFNQVATGVAGQNPGNNSKMFGNNAITEIAYSSQWMKTGGSTNIWFYENPNPIVPGNPPPPSTIPPTANLASLNLTSAGTVNFTPSGGGATNAYNNKYMVGYSPITVVGFGTYIGVPVFPQQNPHLVSTADFHSSPTNYTPPAGNTSIPPNAFSVQAQNQNTEGHAGMVGGQSAMGGSLACAIVGCTIGGVNNVTSPVHFAGSLPGGYVLVSNRSAATPPGGWGNPQIYDDSNSIFNHELNAQGNEGDIMSVGAGGGQYVFYDDNSSTAPSGNGGQVVAQWSAYNNPANSSNGTADPVAPATWTWGGSTMTGPPAVPANIFVSDGSGNAYASNGSAQLGGDGGGQATINQTQVISALEAMGKTPSSEDCMAQMNTPPYYPVDAACGGNSLNSQSTAFNRLGTGPALGGAANPQMFSNVDAVKAQVINAFHSRTIPLTLGPYSAGGMSGAGANPPASGLGCYKANITDPQIAAAPTAANPPSRWSSALDSPLEYTTPGESTNVPDSAGGTDAAVGTTVYAYLNQISGCALSGVINDLTQRCCEIQPNTTTASVISLLQNSPPLYMNTNLYICKSRPNDPTSPLVISATPPSTFQPIAGGNPPPPDGNNVAGTSSDCKSSQYGLSGGSGQGGLIDSQSLNGVSGGDNNLHDQPFMNQSGSIDAQDHADFILSSGYQNELGKLDFYQTIQTSAGGDQFSRPN